MTFRFFKTPWIIKQIFRKGIFNFSRLEKKIYLTFDDGPIPELTEFVLAELKKYDAKATFFCVGANILKNPEIFEKIKNDSHSIGNHTFHHLNGRKTLDKIYFQDIEFCENILKKNSVNNSKILFRPPYGMLNKSQYLFLIRKYKIIFWDILTYDFDMKLSKEECLKQTIKYIKNGSVVVFHDNIKAEKNLKYVLPKVLEHFTELGFEFCRID